MAAEVFTGSGNWSYTNSTGGNVRVIIAYCFNNDASSNYDAGVKQIINGTMLGQGTSGTNMYFKGFGKHILYRDSITSGSLQQKNISGNVAGAFVDEFFLANGQTASLEAVNAGYPIKHYNIMVIPEGN
tara:strand:+ start:141 stop:527 length:387 start_codon:yes stop_codon:yes gene_type:complete